MRQVRERPRIRTAVRRVPVESHPLPQESGEVVYTNTVERQWFKSRGLQYCQPFQPQSYARSIESGLGFSPCKNNRDRNIFCAKTAGETAKLQRFRTFKNRPTSGTHIVCNSYLYFQELDVSTSRSTDRKVHRQTSSLCHPSYVMTRNASSVRSKSAYNNRTKSEDSRYAEPSNISPIPNSLTGQWSFNRARTIIYNTNNANRQISNRDAIQNGTRNNYRNFDESIFKLTSDSSNFDVSGGVTFHLTDDERKSQGMTQVSGVDADNRFMSSPDLPPITNGNIAKGDKRKISSNSVSFAGNKPSVKQLAAPVTRPSNHNRRSSTETTESYTDPSVNMTEGRQDKSRFPFCRVQSDSSQNLRVGGSTHSKGSSSSTITSGIASQSNDARGIGNQSRVNAKMGAVKDKKFLTNGHRAHSLCATDLTESQGRLETLTEGRSSGGNMLTPNNTRNNNTINNNRDSKHVLNQCGIIIKKTSSKGVISNVLYKSARSTNNNSMSSIARPTSSMPGNGIKTRELSSLNHKMSNGNFMTRNSGEAKVDSVDTVIPKGRLVRSTSENKLNGQSIHYNNEHNLHTVSTERQAAHHSISRNIPLGKIERQKLNSQQRSRGVSSGSHQDGTFKIRRFNSVSNVYNETTRDPFHDPQDQEDLYYTEESIEASSRLVEWLSVVNNIDKYDIDPKYDFTDYSDDPPQTDTAIHLVYNGQ